MGASAQRPTSGAPGSGGSGFYQNALNQQKQAVADVAATQAAQTQPGTTPNRPQPSSDFSPPGQQAAPQGQDNLYFNAYNNYMQRHGGSQYPPATGSPFGQAQPPVPQQQQPAAPVGQPPTRPPGGMIPRRPMEQERPPTSPKGITMGAGYSNRPFG